MTIHHRRLLPLADKESKLGSRGKKKKKPVPRAKGISVHLVKTTHSLVAFKHHISRTSRGETVARISAKAQREVAIYSGRGASAAPSSVDAGASALVSVVAAAFSPSLAVSPEGAASPSPPSEDVQSVRLSRSSCMMSVLSR